jgi:tetratricopeptide (TPR) repeat protein
MKQMFYFLTALVISIGCSQKGGKVTTENANNSNKIDVNSIVLKPKIIEKEASDIEKNLYEQAHDLWYNDHPQEALIKLTSFLKKYPNSPLADDAQRLIATAYTNLEDYEKAIEEYKKVSLNYPSGNKASISLYEIAHTYYFKLNDYSTAKKYYESFIQSATEEDKEWVGHAVEQLNNWERNVSFTSSVVSRRNNSSNPQDEFKKYLLENTAVTDVHYESDWQIWVYLKPEKYTSVENVEKIAKQIARWYGRRMNKDFTICTVYQGSRIYAKGNSK